MSYEEMQRKFRGYIVTPTEHELWNELVAKDEDYRVMKTMAWLGWALAIVGPLAIIIG